MRAFIFLWTAKPASVAARILARLAGDDPGGPDGGAAPGRDSVESDEGRAWFEAPDQLAVEGDVAFVQRAFDEASGALDLPPRMVVRSVLPSQASLESLSPELEERLFAFARIVSARHSPKARFEVAFGGYWQVAGAWLGQEVGDVRGALEQDLGSEVGPLSCLSISLGAGDSALQVDLADQVASLVARDAGSLEAIELLASALADEESFRAARATFHQASSTPSEAAERERGEVEGQNLARRTGYLLQRETESVPDLVRRLGVARVRSYLEGEPVEDMPLERQVEALREVPSPGCARAIVQLLLLAHGEEDATLDPIPWLEALAGEPTSAHLAGLEELVLHGAVLPESARRLGAADPARAAHALARAATEGQDHLAREAARKVLAELGPERVAEAFEELPSFRDGLEATWEVVAPLLDRGSRALGGVVTRLQQACERLAESDPAARFLAGRVAEARGDMEGAGRYYDLVVERATDPGLKARASMASAMLAFLRGSIEESLERLFGIALEAGREERDEALESMAACFDKLALADFAAGARARVGGDEPRLFLSLVEGWLESRRGRYGRAAEIFAAVHAEEPLAGEPARVYAAALRAEARDADAVALLEDVCGRVRDDAESFYQLARLHHEASAGEAPDPRARARCLEALEGALTAAPRHARALHLKGVVHEDAGELDEAIRCFHLAVEAPEVLPAAYTGEARALVAAGRFQEAARVFRRSLEVAPECELPGYKQLGILYEDHLDDPEQALFWYQRCLTRGGADDEILARIKEATKRITTYPRSVGQGVSG